MEILAMYQLLAKVKHAVEQLLCSKNEYLGFQLFSLGWARNRHFRVPGQCCISSSAKDHWLFEEAGSGKSGKLVKLWNIAMKGKKPTHFPFPTLDKNQFAMGKQGGIMKLADIVFLLVRRHVHNLLKSMRWKWGITISQPGHFLLILFYSSAHTVMKCLEC